MNTRRVFLLVSVAFLIRSLAAAEARCPGKVEPIQYHRVGLSAIGLSVMINGTGPYEFLVDTGSEVTVIEPSLASELKLESQEDVDVSAIATHSKAELARPDLMEVGSFAVSRPMVVVAPLRQLQIIDPKIRGLLGGTFLGHFDLLIDFAHTVLCFDETKHMRDEVRGEVVPVVGRADSHQRLPFAESLVVRAQLSGENPRDVLLVLDSASNTPLLYRTDTPAWLLRNHQRFGNFVGGGPGGSFAVLPASEVRIGSHVLSAVRFVLPFGVREKAKETHDDGLLPTSLFKRVFISYRDHFVVFDPR